MKNFTTTHLCRWTSLAKIDRLSCFVPELLSALTTFCVSWLIQTSLKMSRRKRKWSCIHRLLCKLCDDVLPTKVLWVFGLSTRSDFRMVAKLQTHDELLPVGKMPLVIVPNVDNDFGEERSDLSRDNGIFGRCETITIHPIRSHPNKRHPAEIHKWKYQTFRITQRFSSKTKFKSSLFSQQTIIDN